MIDSRRRERNASPSHASAAAAGREAALRIFSPPPLPPHKPALRVPLQRGNRTAATDASPTNPLLRLLATTPAVRRIQRPTRSTRGRADSALLPLPPHSPATTAPSSSLSPRKKWDWLSEEAGEGTGFADALASIEQLALSQLDVHNDADAFAAAVENEEGIASATVGLAALAAEKAEVLRLLPSDKSRTEDAVQIALRWADDMQRVLAGNTNDLNVGRVLGNSSAAVSESGDAALQTAPLHRLTLSPPHVARPLPAADIVTAASAVEVEAAAPPMPPRRRVTGTSPIATALTARPPANTSHPHLSSRMAALREAAKARARHHAVVVPAPLRLSEAEAEAARDVAAAPEDTPTPLSSRTVQNRSLVRPTFAMNSGDRRAARQLMLRELAEISVEMSFTKKNQKRQRAEQPGLALLPQLSSHTYVLRWCAIVAFYFPPKASYLLSPPPPR